MELSKTSYVILGMLRGRPHTGYEIKALVDGSTRFFWAASYGQIYPELKRLEEAGLVKGEADVPGRAAAALLLADARGAARAARTGSAPVSRCTSSCATRGCCASSSPTSWTRPSRSSWCATCATMHERTRSEMQAIRPHAEEARAERDQEFPLRTLEFGIAYQEF